MMLRATQCHWAKPQPSGGVANCVKDDGHDGRHRPFRPYMIEGNRARWVTLADWFEKKGKR